MSDEKKMIYIAGPMTGLPEYNAPAFAAAAERLRADGWEVVSPVEMARGYGTFEELEADSRLLERLIMAELEQLFICDAIYLLKGWEKSVGAKCELRHALNDGLDVILEPCAGCGGASGGVYYTPAAVRDFIAESGKEAK